MSIRYGRCRGKVSHASKGKAEAAARSLCEQCKRSGKVVPELNVYCCDVCLGWHVGHQPHPGHRNKYKAKS